jgi:preprotein translocase subunit SecA
VRSPSAGYRQVFYRKPPPFHRGLDAAVNRVVGAYERRAAILAELREEANAVDAQAGEWVELREAHLRERLTDLRERMRRGGRSNAQLVVRALAGIREAADRKLGLRPFPVQLMGALALHRGYLAEMATGEGKTLTAGIAAILAGWTRLPCHIVTVNDYLVERDAEWLQPMYQFCGASVGCVTAAMAPPDRLRGYAADITCVTSNELLADFLRDRLRLGGVTDPSRRLIREWLRPRQAAGGDGMVMRGLDTCIVDEADSILIDEAVTPLIISAPQKNEPLEHAVMAARQIVEALQPDSDYRLNQRYREIEFSETGRAKLAVACGSLDGLWRGHDRRDELIRQALIAREFFLKDRQYIVEGDKVVIVDEFTGRQMPGRSWRQGLHQAIEAKERVPISDPAETIARLSFQRFFRCFRRLSGMTGTGREGAAELWQIYRLPVIAIPTNRPRIRMQWPDRIFLTADEKWAAVADEIQRVHATGQPVLVGTRSVEASERLGQLLTERKLAFALLNAVRHKEEAGIVGLAGERDQITVATNMAGRGTDIKLGKGVAALGGLHVIATERHESGRVDRQLFGRAGRQGDPGSAQAFMSAEDEIVQRYLPGSARELLTMAVRTRFTGWGTIARTAFRAAQNKAERHAAKLRQEVLRSDTWQDESLSFAGTPEV